MFGDRLKELREDANMTQEQLAEKLNINKSSISSYETNSKMPSVDKLVKIADIFKVSLDYLTCRTKDPYNISMQNKVVRDAVIALIKALNKHIK